MQAQQWIGLIAVISAIVVAVDASRLGASRGALGGGLLDMGPASWFFAVLLFWIIALPCYLVARPRLVRRSRVLATHPMFAGTPMPPPAASVPGAAVSGMWAPGVSTAAPGWYPDPTGPGARWWNGANWEQ